MTDWKLTYKNKLVSAREAVSKIKSGDRIWLAPSVATPVQLIEALAERKDELEHVLVISSIALSPYKILQSPEYKGKIDYQTVFMGGYELAAWRKNISGVTSVHLSCMGDCLRDVFNVNVLMSECSPPDEDGYLYYGIGGTFANWDAAQKAEVIIMQVNRNQFKTAGIHHRIHVSEVDYICEHNSPLAEFPQALATEEELKMVEYILPMIEDGATLQLGLGGLPNALGYRLESRKNLSIYTEMYTDSMAYLAKKDVICGRQIAAFALGSREMYDYIKEGKVELMPSSMVNRVDMISRNDKMVSINSGLMADLTGQICSESIGYQQHSGTGGQLDFVRGATASKGGKSFICIKSTYAGKDGRVESRIKSVLPPGAIVTTPRSEVMYVVTEYGIADLWLKPIEERVEAMIAIAHPDFRKQLRADAIRENIVSA